MTPEIVRRQEGKSRGGSTRNPHRGKLQRTPSQTSLSSDEGDGKKIHVSMERLQEMQQREKLYLAKIEDLTTRWKSTKYILKVFIYILLENCIYLKYLCSREIVSFQLY